MNTPRLPESSQISNKLMVRSEVLAVIRHLVTLVNPSKQDRSKPLKRLQELSSRADVLDILVKELQRCVSGKTMQVITELLMELGDIEHLQDKLWALIRDPQTSDEVKDIANLILRHLGDTSDPDLYLEYLQDPQGLINRETLRMLEVSAENPEAMIDFIDFILSLNLEDQIRLLGTLQRDYASEHLVNLYIPLLESDPSPELWEQLILGLSESKSPKAAELFERLAGWAEDRLPIPQRMIQKALKQLQIAGAYHPEQPAATPKAAHSLVLNTQPYHAFITLSDGIGNQGLLFSRQWANGDIAMMSVALNDVHGIIDCFGFFQIGLSDFHKITEKFHEGATKIKVSPEYCAYKLAQAQALNQQKMYRLPYEYRCWQPLLDDITAMTDSEREVLADWVKPDWSAETDNLYQHPDFNSWFLEQGDEPTVTRILHQVISITEDHLAADTPDITFYTGQLASMADTLALELLNTPWRELIMQRLQEAAYLLNCQEMHTFRNLAATEAHKLQAVTEPAQVLPGFLQAYGRRCVAEELLRLRTASTSYEQLSPLVDAVLDAWSL